MARVLVFEIDGAQIEVGMEKLDRKKIYGWVDKKPVDVSGRTCYFGALSADGSHIFGPGCFEMGHMDEGGSWVERTELRAVDKAGHFLEKLESTFKRTITLDEQVPIETYLDYTAKLVYQLEASQDLIDQVRDADGIFRFPYNYMASFTPDDAFLIESEGNLFLVVGEPVGMEFVGPDQIFAAEEDEGEEESDDLDFGMF